MLAQISLLDPKTPIGDDLYTRAGRCVRITEQDGDTVIWRDAVTSATGIGEVGKDLVKIRQLLDIDAQITAITTSPTFRAAWRCDPKAGLKSKANFGTVVVFNDGLCYRFFKQGGYVPHFAPINGAEAKGLLLGTHELKYIKGGNGFRIAVK